MRPLPQPIAALVAEGEGSRRLGAFSLVRQLGAGGFAPVWLANEEYAGQLLRTVALKLFPLPVGSDDDVARETRLLIEEAHALCRVEHPNVVRFHSVVIDKERGVAGFSMEHLAGPSLDRILANRERFSTTDAIDVGIAISSALAAVHRAGIVHRDVKPANIIETPSGYKLIDFGIALGAREGRTLAAGKVELLDVPLEATQNYPSTLRVRAVAGSGPDADATMGVEVAAGTLGYMAPEILTRASPSHPASDLYGLGATLYEIVTGRVPAAQDGDKLRGDILDGRRRPPRLQGVDEAFAELVHQLLAPSRVERPKSADWVLTKLEQLRYVLGGRDRELPDESTGPFRGLARFDSSDRGVYFGRSLEIAQALHVLRVRGLVALLGPSGSGKSSLASAGLLPAIEDGRLELWPPDWDTVRLSPGPDPRALLLQLLAPLLELEDDASASDVVHALGARAERSRRGVALLIDQLEELATVSHEEPRKWLIDLIALAAEHAVPGLRVVVTARRDMLDPLLEFAALGRVLLRNAVLVEPMSAVTWGEVLDQALSAYGYRLEDAELREELLLQIGRTASAMPLVGFALARLWTMRDQREKIIPWKALDALGGIAGALAQHAESTLEELRRAEPGSDLVARRVLLSLTTPHGTRATRSEKALVAVGGDGSLRVIAALESARILEQTPGGLTLAHEVLLSEWSTLRHWVNEARESRLLAQELEQDAERNLVDADGAPLWQRRRLQQARDMLGRGDVGLSERAEQFLRASERVVQRRRWLMTGLAALGVIGAASGAGAYLGAINAEKANTQKALERERSTRKLAEDRTREVQQAQERIDELLLGMKDSPTKEAVVELQRQILPERVVVQKAARPPEATAARDQPAEAPKPAPSASPPVGIKVQSEW